MKPNETTTTCAIFFSALRWQMNSCQKSMYVYLPYYYIHIISTNERMKVFRRYLRTFEGVYKNTLVLYPYLRRYEGIYCM